MHNMKSIVLSDSTYAFCAILHLFSTEMILTEFIMIQING